MIQEGREREKEQTLLVIKKGPHPLKVSYNGLFGNQRVEEDLNLTKVFLFLFFNQRASYFEGEAAGDRVFGRGSSAAVGLLPEKGQLSYCQISCHIRMKNEGFL